jgi:hypothetical protein
LQPGSYTTVVKFEPGTVTGRPHLDVCSGFGTETHASSGDFGATVDAKGEASLAFSLRDPREDVEIRVHSRGDFAGLYLGTALVRDGPPAASHPNDKSGD